MVLRGLAFLAAGFFAMGAALGIAAGNYERAWRPLSMVAIIVLALRVHDVKRGWPVERTKEKA